MNGLIEIGSVSRETKGNTTANPIVKDVSTDSQVALCVNRPNSAPDTPIYNHGTVKCDGDVQ